MHPIVLLFVISLLHAYEARGSDTGTPVFVQKGKDLLLHVTAPVKLVERDIFAWKFKDSNIFRLFDDNKAIITDPYVGRVEIFRQNHSLLLKNVQQNDSGSYIAVVFGKNNNDVGKYSVTVQDPVSLVTGTVDLLSSSSDSCNLTVTCSTQDSHHIISTFRCDNTTCSQEEGGERSKVTTSGSSLRVYLSKNFSVICNHSNQVSSDEHTTMIRDFCFKHPGHEPPSNRNIAIGTVTVIVVLVIAAIAAAFVRHRKKGKHETEEMKNTVYETVQHYSASLLVLLACA
ncbi:SLAM family member 5-like isoform X2 [Platichthys flesus]|uniref:SLAM family member 5-like isoform X2 n=1 Tax=Platichthys flesus TaxID=8260 RepID=UPI002DB5CB65|nr:SLAM family member 5-like isoform X2 [Platichthys flesus]